MSWVLGVIGATLAGAWVVAQATSSDVPHRTVIVLLTVAVVVIAVVAVNRWRVGLYFLLVWLVLEDLPRKLLGNDLLVYFGKDILVAAVYVGFFLELRARHTRAFRPPFLAPLLWFAGVCLVEVLNPSSPSLLYGLLGLKLYLFYVPLLLLGYALIDGQQDLRRFLLFNLVVAGAVAGLGIVQAVVGAGFLNPDITPEQLNLLRLVRRAPLSGELVPRPTSVFVSDGRFYWYMLLSLCLSLSTIAFQRAHKGLRTSIPIVALALTAAAILLSGSRAAVVYAAVTVLVFTPVVLWGLDRDAVFKKSWVPATRALVLAAAACLGAALLFPEAVGARWAFYYQTLSPWSPASELAYRVAQYPVSDFLKAFTYPRWPLGYGIGTASLGVEYITSVFQLPSTGAAVESGYGTLLVEMGIAGLLAWLVWTISLTWAAWKAVRKVRGSTVFPVAFGILWFVFVLLFPLTYGGIQPYQNFIFNAYLWLLVGILFRLPTLVPVRTTDKHIVEAHGSA